MLITEDAEAAGVARDGIGCELQNNAFHFIIVFEEKLSYYRAFKDVYLIILTMVQIHFNTNDEIEEFCPQPKFNCEIYFKSVSNLPTYKL